MGLIRVVVGFDLGGEVKGIGLLLSAAVPIVEGGAELAAPQGAVEGVGHHSAVLTYAGAVLAGGDAEQQVHGGGGASDGEFLDHLHIVRLGLGDIVQPVDAVFRTLVHIGDVNPAHPADHPAAADAGAALEGDGDVLNVQLVEHVAGGGGVIADDAHGADVSIILRGLDLEGFGDPPAEGVGGQLLVGQHHAAGPVLKDQLKIEVVSAARVLQVSHLHVHLIDEFGDGQPKIFQGFLIGHGIGQAG